MDQSILIKAKKLELHYWFSDKSHSMDALVYNKCEREWLEIAKAVGSLCGVSIKLETEPSSRGGLKSWLTIHAKSEKKTSPSKITMVITLVAAAMVTPIDESIHLIAEKLIDNFLNEEEPNDEVQKQRQEEVDQLKAALPDLAERLDKSAAIKKRRSNFYQQLNKCQKVKTVSIAVTDSSRKMISEEQHITREAFTSFIVVSGPLAPVVLENVAIEIISPVLGQGNFKWKGKYQGVPISFSMKSDEFMSLVQSGKMEFKNGTTINCTLQLEKRMNSEGIERITGYTILRVATYFENGKAIETSEGKQHRQKQTESKRQLDLFG